jgi:hypothetical protein
MKTSKQILKEMIQELKVKRDIQEKEIIKSKIELDALMVLWNRNYLK